MPHHNWYGADETPLRMKAVADKVLSATGEHAAVIAGPNTGIVTLFPVGRAAPHPAVQGDSQWLPAIVIGADSTIKDGQLPQIGILPLTGAPKGCLMGWSKKGGMNKDLFLQFLEKFIADLPPADHDIAPKVPPKKRDCSGIPIAECSRWTVEYLVTECKRRGLRHAGKKPELVVRLLVDLDLEAAKAQMSPFNGQSIGVYF